MHVCLLIIRPIKTVNQCYGTRIVRPIKTLNQCYGTRYALFELDFISYLNLYL